MLEEDHGGLMPDHRGFLDIVRRNSQRLLDLVGDLLFVAQVDAGKLTLETTRIDLVGLASECVETMRPRALDRQIDMRLESSGPIGIDGDPLRLGQLLDNLVSNAIKFTPERGHVVVRVMREEAGVVLAVADTGIGISKDEQAKLFERFFRTEGATRLAIQGTGLGLTIAKAIAEAHGGAISVESTPGIGTEFRVDFPPPAELAGELAA
jgi:signal transduction histidine kinase